MLGIIAVMVCCISLWHSVRARDEVYSLMYDIQKQKKEVDILCEELKKNLNQKY